MAESCHFYDGVHHAQLKPYVLWKKTYLFYRGFISRQNTKVKRKGVDKIPLERSSKKDEGKA